MGNQPTIEVSIDEERRRPPAGAVNEVYYPSNTVTEVTYPSNTEVTYNSDGITEVTYPTNSATEVVYPPYIPPAGTVGPYRPEVDVVVDDSTADVTITSNEQISFGTTDVYIQEGWSRSPAYVEEEVIAPMPYVEPYPTETVVISGASPYGETTEVIAPMHYVEPYPTETVVISGASPYGGTTVYTNNEPYRSEPAVIIEDNEPYVTETVEVFGRSYSTSSSSSDDEY